MSDRIPARMTVGELIAKLQAFPPDTPIMIDGYEWGLDYPLSVSEVTVRQDESDDDITHGGRFREVGSHEHAEAIVVVYIQRNT